MNKAEIETEVENVEVNNIDNTNIDNDMEESIEEEIQELPNKENIVIQYQKALVAAIDSVKDDFTATEELKKVDEDIKSYYTTKKILYDLQRKIKKLEPLNDTDYKFLSVVCYLNVDKMTKYGQSILDQAQIVANLAKIFIS